MFFSQSMSYVGTEGFEGRLYQELQKSRWTTLLYWLACLVAAVLAFAKRDRHIIRLFTQGKSFVAALLVQQIVRNQGANLVAETKTKSAILRRFNQLPCTPETRMFRADLISRLCKSDDPILVIGDDDYLSVELCSRGFENVTVLDICPKVLNEIRMRTKDFKCQPPILACDLTLGLDASLRHRFKVVTTDPPCTIEGVGLFLQAAVDAFSKEDGGVLVLTTHLLSQTEEGLRTLEKVFMRNRLAVQEVFEASSVYPFPRDLRVLVEGLLAVCALVVSPPFRRRLLTLAPRFFFSDTLVARQAAVESVVVNHPLHLPGLFRYTRESSAKEPLCFPR